MAEKFHCMEFVHQPGRVLLPPRTGELRPENDAHENKVRKEEAMTAQTLLLSAGYEPIKVVSWQRAITLLTLGKIEVFEEYDCDVRSPSIVFKIPAVVRLLQIFKRNKRRVKFSRINIYARDKYRCQYCSRKLPIVDLTYDHVVPRAKGGRTVWENIVTACEPCNSRKGNRTPEQAHMRLLTRPIRPKWVPVMTLRVNRDTAPDAWRDYLYWTGKLQSG